MGEQDKQDSFIYSAVPYSWESGPFSACVRQDKTAANMKDG